MDSKVSRADRKKRYPSARIALQALNEPPKTSTAQPVVSVPAKPAKRSLFGETYWQAKFLTTELHRVEPKWKMIQKRNNGLLDHLRKHLRMQGRTKTGINTDEV